MRNEIKESTKHASSHDLVMSQLADHTMKWKKHEQKIEN